MRRVLVTPTFAAGLGIVIAALLAVPVSQLSLQIVQPKGEPCRLKGCAPIAQGSAGSLASAPSRRLVTRPPKRSHGGGSTGSPSPAPGGGPRLTYHTIQEWNGNFVGALTITPSAPIPSSGWKLRIGYRSAEITSVWGARWKQEGAHTAVIQPWGHWGQRRSEIRIVVTARGPAGPPASCAFDGQDCQITVVNSGGGWRGAAHKHRRQSI